MTIQMVGRAQGLPLALALGALLSVPAIAADNAQDASGRKLTATMTGAAERPDPGDADATGKFGARVNPGQTQLCYEISVNNIDVATAAHIHKGGPDVAGPVAVPLNAPGADGMSKGCADISRDLAANLVKSPQDYYVNVHNATHPGGAVRGQLARATDQQ